MQEEKEEMRVGIVAKILSINKRRKDPVGYWRQQGCTIGEDCEIYQSASLGSEPYLVKIGKHVRITEGVRFMTHDGGVWVLRGMDNDFRDVDLFGQITVGDNVHIGTDVTIMPNVTIGTNCIIGCGAIVTKDIPDNSIAVGVPARVIETIDEYIEKNKERLMHTKFLNGDEKKKILMTLKKAENGF